MLSALQRAVGGALGARAAAAEAASAQAHAVRPMMRARKSHPRATDPPLVIALSGGSDSTVLLDLAVRLRDGGETGFGRLVAVHVHHGLQPEADAWVEHCRSFCAERAVECLVHAVRVDRRQGVEAGARAARYAALAEAARTCGAPLVLTAHHADDRIETFLLQWLRGAGPDGLAGMPPDRALVDEGAATRPHGALQLVRPLLEVGRDELEAYRVRHGLACVEDPSNADLHYARNALRHAVLPQLARLRSGYRKSAARSIELVAEAAQILDELAAEALAACTLDAPAGMLRIDRLAALAPARQTLVLRAWLAREGVTQPPSRARLRETMAQALGGRDGRMLIRIGPRELRRHRGLLCLRAVRGGGTRQRETVHWRGEHEIPVASWGGVLRFVEDDRGPGFEPAWLQELPLEVRARTGGERLKPQVSRPSRRLKQLYQEAGIPEFERRDLPLVWREDQLIYVARVGADARLTAAGPRRVRLEWHGAASLLGTL